MGNHPRKADGPAGVSARSLIGHGPADRDGREDGGRAQSGALHLEAEQLLRLLPQKSHVDAGTQPLR